jgi:hypothetical protein
MSVKALKRALKKAGLKTTGKKAALTRRAKKAHLKMRGAGGETTEEEMANPLSALPLSPENSETEAEAEAGDSSTMGGASAKSLRRALKKAGLKTTGRKSTLSKRAKKAGLKVGGGPEDIMGGNDE